MISHEDGYIVATEPAFSKALFGKIYTDKRLAFLECKVRNEILEKQFGKKQFKKMKVFGIHYYVGDGEIVS